VGPLQQLLPWPQEYMLSFSRDSLYMRQSLLTSKNAGENISQNLKGKEFRDRRIAAGPGTFPYVTSKMLKTPSF